MIEINGTFFIQLANFLLMIFFLNHFLFKPVLAMVERRNEKMSSLESDAARYKDKGEHVMKDYEDKLYEMRKEASGMLAAARKGGLAEQEKIVGQARREFTLQIENAKNEIGRESKKASESLKKEVEEISSDIAKTLLGREV